MAAEPLLCIGQLHLPGKTQDMRIVDDWLQGLQQQHAWHSRLHFKMELVLHEALPNIFEHADHPEDHPLEVIMFRMAHGYCLQISDAGVPFDPLLQPGFLPAQHLDAANINGRGIHLIRQFTDKQSYRRVNDKNVLKLHFIS